MSCDIQKDTCDACGCSMEIEPSLVKMIVSMPLN